VKEFKKDNLIIRQYESRKLMGEAAANAVSEQITELFKTKENVNIIFAAAPSQNELLAALSDKHLPWHHINAFHMDEYIGLPQGSPELFRYYLDSHIFSTHTFRSIHYLNGNARNLEAECKRYECLLKQCPPDVVCMGIGENGHIAFNDPHIADFEDKQIVKVVDLDPVCRQQQVNDACFSNINLVPHQALTLTIPAITQARYLYCVVPGPKKANAVHNTLNQDIHRDYPSTILRKHEHAILFLDDESAMQLAKQ
jgi:glucosamine-6-phosphate deaminase